MNRASISPPCRTGLGVLQSVPSYFRPGKALVGLHIAHQDWIMLARKPVFPNVIELNVQAGQRLGCNVYLIYDGPEWLLIDIGFDDVVDEIVELIRQMDFPLSHCQ